MVHSPQGCVGGPEFNLRGSLAMTSGYPSGHASTRSDQATINGANDTPARFRGRRVYALASVGLVLWSAYIVFWMVAVFPTGIYWMSYYVANYHFGFVRRGLAGELLDLLPTAQYFTARGALMWASAAVWLAAVGLFMWLIYSTGVKSERRVTLALLVPTLPFAISYALYSPRPELFAMTALLIFAIAVSRTRGSQPRLVLSALYGTSIAVLAFAHEAIPLMLALGAVLALTVLADGLSPAVRRVSILLAVGPGLLASLSVAVLGRVDNAAQLCAAVPHKMVENPYAAARVSPEYLLQYMLGRVESRADYHDWVCPNVIAYLGTNSAGGVTMVLQLGFAALLASFLFGALYFAGTLWAIGYFSGTRIPVFVDALRGQPALPVMACLLVLPVFATGFDWIRWWILITVDVAIVYILFVIERSDIERPPARKHVQVFVVTATVFALLATATSASPNFGGVRFVDTTSTSTSPSP